MQKFIVTVEGPNFEDIEEVELPALPTAGQPLETKYGTAIVTKGENLPDDPRFDGRITCRIPR